MRASFEAVVRDPTGRTFAVPTIELDEFHEFHHVARVNQEAERLCGARVTTLRCLSSEPVAEDARHRRYELEAQGPVRGLAEVEVELPPPGNAWEVPGWFDEAAEWIRERVDAPVEQRSARSISALLRAGDVWFKAVPQVFAAEPAITLALSREHPGRVPDVLDADLERGWLLMSNFGGERLADHAVGAWAEALRVYADIQLAWVGRTQELLAMGCPDRSLPELDRQIDVVLADRDELRERLHEAVARVASLEITPTLDHGNLHADNIVVRAAGPLVFDWSDGSLAVPLVSVIPFLEWNGPPAGARQALLHLYLERIGVAPEAYEDAVLLGLAHQLVSYDGILRGLAPQSRWEWEYVPPWLVKQLVERTTAA
jgi:hypothetical protein